MKIKRFYRIISLLLALVILTSSISLSAFATSTDGDNGVLDWFWDLFHKTSVSVQGLPENAEPSIEKIDNPFNRKSGTSNVGTFLGFYDIKATDKTTGKEVHPNGEVEVRIQGASIEKDQSVYIIHVLDSAEAILNNPKVRYIDDTAFVNAFKTEAKLTETVTGKKNVVAVEIISDVTVDGKDLTFKTKSFSIFSIVDNPIVIINFYESTAEGAQPVESIRVKQADTVDDEEFARVVYEPGIESVTAAQALFRGWTTNPDYSVNDADSALSIQDVRDDIKNQLNETNPPSEINYYAMLFKRYTVTFYDEYHVTCFGVDYALQRYDDSQVKPLNFRVNVPYTPYTEAASFLGWKLEEDYYSNFNGVFTQLEDDENPTEGMTPALTGNEAKQYIYNNPVWVQITGDISLYAYAPGGNWLVFNENGKGATYYAPQFVEDGHTTFEPQGDQNPERNGYIFDGWYYFPNGVEVPAAIDGVIDLTNAVEFIFGLEFTKVENNVYYNDELVTNHSITLYAKWIPVSTANYTIIIWKQNVNGDGYDFAESKTIADSVGIEISSVTSTGTGNDAYATVDGIRKQYTGFHLDHFDQHVVIKPEGTSILNVYYDRNIVTLTFQIYQSGSNNWTITNDVTGELYGLVGSDYVRIYTNDGGQTWYTNSNLTYESTEDLTDPLYGLVGTNYILLTKIGESWYYIDNDQYVANEIGNPKYGLIDGNYIELTERNGHYYYISGTELQYVQTTGTSGTQYGLVDGEYVQIHRNNNGNNWYYYVYTASTDTNRTMYGYINGQYVLLNRVTVWDGPFSSHYEYEYNGQTYTGTRYTRTEKRYSGTRYLLNEVDIESEYTDTVYTHTVPYSDTYYKPTNTPYTGSRYKRAGSGWNTIHQLIGLYGAPLSTSSTSDKAWPTDYWWYERYQQGYYGGYSGAGTRTTFLDAFLLSDGSSDETFYGFTGSGSNTIRFYKQNPDGSWPALNSPTNTVTSGNGTFNISDKYNGYKAASYSTNGTSWTNLGDKNAQGYYASVDNYTNLYIRFEPLKYNVLYMDGVYVDGNNNPVAGYSSRGKLGEVDNINYASDLSSYNKDGDNYFSPTFNGFVFEGWYIDDACTHPYTFTSMTEGITVYAKWRLIQYRVFLHPNAGSGEDHDTSLTWGSDAQQMSFRVSYGGTISIPTGRRDLYNFLGWYTSPDFSSDSYFYSGNRLNESTTGLSAYNKETDYTDPIDKWGDLGENPTNSDLVGYNGGDRFWITKKLDLYAKWSYKLVGAEGIYVEYDSGEGYFVAADSSQFNLYCDNLLYADHSNSYAIAASYPNNTAYHFSSWQPQVFNYSTGEWTDAGEVIFPGQKFLVTFEDSGIKIERSTYNEGTWGEWETISASDIVDDVQYKYKYTIRLRANYLPAVPQETTLVYDANGGSFTDSVPSGYTAGTSSDGYNIITKDSIFVNEAIDILTGSIVTREGYTFKGWSLERDGEKFLNGGETNYAADNLTSTPTGNDPSNTLYAIWEINRYKVDVVKVLENFGISDTYDNDYKFTFDYTITYPTDYTPVTGDAASTTGAKVSVNTKYTIENIPHGSSLTVTETLTTAEGNVFTVSYTNNVINSVTAENDGDLAAIVTITNTRKLGKITISKSLSEGTATNERFIFQITGENLTNPIIVTLEAGQSITVAELQPGTYKVTELTAWSWRYDAVGNTEISVTITGGDTKTAAFTNIRNTENWLYGETYKDNAFSGIASSSK